MRVNEQPQRSDVPHATMTVHGCDDVQRIR